MSTINDADAEAIEAEARSLLRQQLRESAWYPHMPDTKRLKLIEQDVERYWHLKVTEAAKRVLERLCVLANLGIPLALSSVGQAL